MKAVSVCCTGRCEAAREQAAMILVNFNLYHSQAKHCVKFYYAELRGPGFKIVAAQAFNAPLS